MKIKEIPKSMSIVVMIGQAPLLTNALVQDIVFSL